MVGSSPAARPLWRNGTRASAAHSPLRSEFPQCIHSGGIEIASSPRSAGKASQSTRRPLINAPSSRDSKRAKRATRTSEQEPSDFTRRLRARERAGESEERSPLATPQGPRTFVTDSEGAFFAPYLTPGTDAIKIERHGFRTLDRQNIEVRLGQRIDLTLPCAGRSRDSSATTTGSRIRGSRRVRLPDQRSVFNSQTPTDYDPDTQTTFPVANPDFGQPVRSNLAQLQTPRQIRFGVRYEF